MSGHVRSTISGSKVFRVILRYKGPFLALGPGRAPVFFCLWCVTDGEERAIDRQRYYGERGSPRNEDEQEPRGLEKDEGARASYCNWQRDSRLDQMFDVLNQASKKVVLLPVLQAPVASYTPGKPACTWYLKALIDQAP